jgi:hypothetical protein
MRAGGARARVTMLLDTWRGRVRVECYWRRFLGLRILATVR